MMGGPFKVHDGGTPHHPSLCPSLEKGLRIGAKSRRWNDCLAIDLFADSIVDPDWPDYWDRKLVQMDEDEWNGVNYHREKHNCFDFVLSFLKSLKCDGISCEKVDFCQKYVLPKIKSALNYIELYRRIRKSPCNTYTANDRRSIKM